MQYNASCAGEMKTVVQLKTIYQNIKANLRKELTNEKLEQFTCTGGTTSDVVKDDNQYSEKFTTNLPDSSTEILDSNVENEHTLYDEPETITATPSLARTRASKHKMSNERINDLQRKYLESKILVNKAKEAAQKAKAEYYRSNLKQSHYFPCSLFLILLCIFLCFVMFHMSSFLLQLKWID